MTAHQAARSPELPDTDAGLADLGELTRLEGTPAPELQRVNVETHRLAEWALIDMGAVPAPETQHLDTGGYPDGHPWGLNDWLDS